MRTKASIYNVPENILVFTAQIAVEAANNPNKVNANLYKYLLVALKNAETIPTSDKFTNKDIEELTSLIVASTSDIVSKFIEEERVEFEILAYAWTIMAMQLGSIYQSSIDATCLKVAATKLIADLFQVYTLDHIVERINRSGYISEHSTHHYKGNPIALLTFFIGTKMLINLGKNIDLVRVFLSVEKVIKMDEVKL